MPLNIAIGILSVVVALVLYSVGTWGAFLRRSFTRTGLTLLWVGAFFDVLATVMMALQIGGLDLRPGVPTIHTVLALVAMAGMIAGTAIATSAVARADEKLQLTLSRWLLAPWALWAAVFVWGMATRGAARMGG